MTQTAVVTRNGEQKLTVPAELKNGILRSGENILINSDLIAASGMSRDYVLAEIKSHRISPEIEALGMRMGDNGNGLVCRWEGDIIAEERVAAKKAYDALPAEVRAAKEERDAITRLYDQAYKALNYDRDDDNVSRGYSSRAEANRRLAAWRESYPEEAAYKAAEEARRKKDFEDSFIGQGID